MNTTEIINMLVYFINPLNVLTKGWLAIFDVFTFIIIPYVILKMHYKIVWWRVILFYIGFVLTQISIITDPILEYILEVGGIVLILYGCLKDEKKEIK